MNEIEYKMETGNEIETSTFFGQLAAHLPLNCLKRWHSL